MSAKLERLLEKEAQLKAQIQQAKAAEKTLERKRDTRRKILIGSAVMARVESGRWPKDDLLSMMDGFLSRENERELFGLGETVEPEPEKAATQNGQKQAKPKRKVKPLPQPDDDLDDQFKL